MNDHGSMNRIYRLVWSQVRSAWVPAAETARGRGKGGSRRGRQARAAAAATLSLAGLPLAQASPPASACVTACAAVTGLSSLAHPLGGQVGSRARSCPSTG